MPFAAQLPFLERTDCPRTQGAPQVLRLLVHLPVICNGKSRTVGAKRRQSDSAPVSVGAAENCPGQQVIVLDKEQFLCSRKEKQKHKTYWMGDQDAAVPAGIRNNCSAGRAALL